MEEIFDSEGCQFILHLEPLQRRSVISSQSYQWISICIHWSYGTKALLTKDTPTDRLENKSVNASEPSRKNRNRCQPCYKDTEDCRSNYLCGKCKTYVYENTKKSFAKNVFSRTTRKMTVLIQFCTEMS